MILHCGGAEEVGFIKFLNNAITACRCNGNEFDLQYTTFHGQQTNRETVMLMDAEKFKKKNRPVILLVSKDFLHTIWSSPQKRAFMKIVTSLKSCLHIWLDVNENDIKRHSNILLRKDQNFGRIYFHELTSIPEPSQNVETLTILRSFLFTNNRSNCNTLNNYAVDDEVDEMRRNFEAAYPSTIVQDYVNSDILKTMVPKLKELNLTHDEIEREKLYSKIKQNVNVDRRPSRQSVLQH